MIEILYLVVLFVIYTMFNLITVYYTIRIKDRIIPKAILGIFIYYLILVSYIMNIVEPASPFRSIDIIFQTSLFGVVEVMFLFFWLKMKSKELDQI